MDTLVEYYSQRASEYDRIYHRDDPVRQGELDQIASLLRQSFSRKRVLEAACGTGFWTQKIAEVASSVLGIDASTEMLALARRKVGQLQNVQLEVGDAFHLESLEGDFDAGLAMFWYSHIPRARLTEFLRGFHGRLGRGAVVVIADNIHVPGVGGKLVTDPDSKDTFKIRELPDGSKHRILKNYYSEIELRKALGGQVTDLEAHFGANYWWARYRVA